jgi:ankyrin repeat protein
MESIMNNVIKFLCLNPLLIGSASLAMDGLPAKALKSDGWEPTQRKITPYQVNQLHNAAQTGNLELVQELLDAGTPVDAKNTYGWTSLHKAAINGHESVCKLLLDYKAEVDAKNDEGKTPLMLAAAWDHKEICQLLLDHNAQIDAKTNNGSTPLREATWRNNKITFPVLIDAQIKRIKAAAITFLGIKKFRNNAYFAKWIDTNIAKLIACQVVNAEIINLSAQINRIEGRYMREYAHAYASEQLNPQKQKDNYCVIA